MVRKCIVLQCSNHSKHPKSTIHRFPTKRMPRKRSKWVEFAKDSHNGDLRVKNIDDYGVCSLHFTSYDFLAKDGGRKRLKLDAIPTLSSEAETLTLKLSNAEHQIYQQKREIDDLKLELETTKRNLAEEKSKNEKLASLFLPSQIKKILNPSLAFVKWTNTEVAKALSLYSSSPQAYEVLKTSWNFPLPSKSTLHRHLRLLELSPGIIMPVIKLLSDTMSTEPPQSLSRLCILAFDEISISPEYSYDHSMDQVFGGKGYINVICVRGLFAKWKQPVYYSFEVSTQQILDLITLLFQHGIEVVGITSDMGPKNQRIWKELMVGRTGIFNTINTSFKHPLSNRNVYVFPDFPHLLKSLRNNFLDVGITLKSGIVIDKSWIVELLEMQDKFDLRPCFKLSYKHINMQGQERQNVRTAFQLFSHATATLIRERMTHREGFKEVANFFDIVNNFADLMNCRSPVVLQNPFKCAYGLKIQLQRRCLQQAYQLFSSMKVGHRQRAMAPFQKGLLMSITSLSKLQINLKTRFPLLRFILTNRLNQDFLENMFSLIRGYGRTNTNPNAVSFKFRLRKVILSWNKLDDESVSSKLISQTDEVTNTNNESETNHIMRVNRAPALRANNSMTNEEYCKIAGQEYVAGYIGKRLKASFPEMALNFEIEESQYLWVGILSKGGLTEPSTMWFQYFRRFEQVFIALHGINSCNKRARVVETLKEELKNRFPYVPVEWVNMYARLRTFLRIKHLNRGLEDEKYAWKG